MKKELFIHSFKSILPIHSQPQDETVEWTLNAHLRSFRESGNEVGLEMERNLRRYTLNSKYIQQRYFECDDINENWDEHEIYKITSSNPAGESIGKRNAIFESKSRRIFQELYPDSGPNHIVHVTCTGYVSPDPVQIHFSRFENAPSITHAYHMGCYASLPAIRMAMGLSLLESNSVDVVHTEMCSLHLNPSLHTPEQMIVQTLFADGHIKYSVGTEKKGFKVLSILEKIIPDSLGDMTWIPDSYGMKMTLSRAVPSKIKDNLPAFIDELCQKAGFKREEILRDGIFAIHPGGPKIIEAVQKKLELSDEQVRVGKEVLFTRGNMSSATLPHVWELLLKSKTHKGRKVLSLAFGPGLTIFGAIFEVEQ